MQGIKESLDVGILPSMCGKADCSDVAEKP